MLENRDSPHWLYKWSKKVFVFSFHKTNPSSIADQNICSQYRAFNRTARCSPWVTSNTTFISCVFKKPSIHGSFMALVPATVRLICWALRPLMCGFLKQHSGMPLLPSYHHEHLIRSLGLASCLCSDSAQGDGLQAMRPLIEPVRASA